MLQVNIQCIRNKILELEHFCDEHKIDVISVAEHWLQVEQVDVFTPQGYIPASLFCRKEKKNGGSGVFVKIGIDFSVINADRFNSELNCEISCIKLKKENLIIVSVYRSPMGNVNFSWKI